MGTTARLGVCLLVLALASAGCQAPMADADSAPTVTADSKPQVGNQTGTAVTSPPEIRVLNGSLELDPGRVFARLQTVAGTNVTAPKAVRVYENATAFYGTENGSGPTLPRFWRVAGIDSGAVNSSTLEVQKNGYVRGTGEVVIYLSPNTTLADERLLLAHEFTHYIQTQQNRRADLTDVLGITTTQSGYVTRSVIEGTAVYTTDAYVREYAPGAKLNSPWYDEIQASYPPGHVGRLQNARYVHGNEYVSAGVDSPTAVASVYENPPRTSEQLLHGLAPDAEPATALSVDSTTGDEWLASGTDTLGEAFVRYALSGDVRQTRATRAATGWGNDSLHIFRPLDGGSAGYVWLLDWDDMANATEFERTLRAAFDARGTATDGVWSLPDADTSATVLEVREETTAVVFGSDTFLTAATVDATDDSVTIGVRG